MNFSIHNSVHFCLGFRNPSATVEGKFSENRLKRLNQSERKTCLTALRMIEKAKNADFVLKENEEVQDNHLLTAISQKLLENLPGASPHTGKQKSKSPLVGLAHAVQSLFKWVQNTFCGRLSSKHLLDKVETYRQDAQLAPSRIAEITDINEGQLPKLQIALREKIDLRDNICLTEKLSNGLVQGVYGLLLRLKVMEKMESIMSKAVSHVHVEGIQDIETTPFYQDVYLLLSHYFSPEKNVSFVDAEKSELTPSFAASKSSQIIKENLSSLWDAACLAANNPSKENIENVELQFNESFKSIEEQINEQGKELHQITYGNPPSTDDNEFEWDKVNEYGLKKIKGMEVRLVQEVELLEKKYQISKV